MYFGAEIANKNYAHRSVQVGTTTVSAVGNSDGVTPATGRKYVHLYNMSGKAVFWSCDSALTSANVVSKAFGSIADGQEAVLPYGPHLLVYLVCQTGSATVAISELV